MRAFHVARGDIAAGDRLNTNQHADLTTLFPDGVSNFGASYLRDPLFHSDLNRRSDLMLDAILEAVRRYGYPDRLSRFEAVFAVEDLPTATVWQRRFGGGSHVYEVEAELGHRADVATLDGIPTAAEFLQKRAPAYWEGIEFGNPPSWELLLKSPVTVIRRLP